MKSQLEKTTKIKPDLCERCEGDEGWLDTPHAFCDDCMSEVLACANFANDPHGLDLAHYQNAYNYYA
jgi:hypothetical protein